MFILEKPLFSTGDIIAIIGIIIIPIIYYWITNRKNAFEKIKKTIIGIQQSINNIEKYLISRNPSAINQFSQSTSPRTLNPLGEEILNNSGGKLYIDNFLRKCLVLKKMYIFLKQKNPLFQKYLTLNKFKKEEQYNEK